MKLFSANIETYVSVHRQSPKALDMEQKITKDLPTMIEHIYGPPTLISFSSISRRRAGHVLQVETSFATQREASTTPARFIGSLTTEPKTTSGRPDPHNVTFAIASAQQSTSRDSPS